MIRLPPRSTLFPSRRSSDLRIRETHGPSVRRPERRRIGEQQPRSSRRGRQVGLFYAVDAVTELRELRLRHGRNSDRKSTRLNSSHSQISYAVFCLKKKKT